VNGMCQGGGCPDGRPQCGTTCCQTGETCLQGLACCPTAQVCGTGTNAICCPQAATCVNGLCECDEPGALACGDQCVACEGGTVNSDTCMCECPPDKVLNNGQCVVSAGCTSGSSCGACTNPDTGQPETCLCSTLAGGTGTFCFKSALCASSCAECVNFPGTVCVQEERCPAGFPMACATPCQAGEPCPPFPF
jgi:hypothetical protein